MKGESFKVGRGRFTVKVYPVATSTSRGWRFKKRDGKTVMRKKKEQAREQARLYLASLEAGESYLYELSPEKKRLVAKIIKELPTERELERFLEIMRSRNHSPKVGEVVDWYLKEKEAQKGKQTSHLKQVGAILRELAVSFNGQALAEVGTVELREWFARRVKGLSPSRNNNVRAAVVALWNWAAKMGHLPKESTLHASRLRRLSVEVSEIRIASIDETLFILKSVVPEFRLAVVLSLFAGLRPEQSAPDSRRGKVGLSRSAISPGDGVIYVSKEVSKTFAHVVPITPCLEAWLEWAGWEDDQFFPVARQSMAQARETLRLGRLMNERYEREEGWPSDFLRHTYGSNRNAILRNLAQVAEEMGTSPKMMHSHYHQPRPKESGEAFFNLRPCDLQESEILPFPKAL